MSNRGTEDILDQLHGLQAEALRNYLQAVKDGEAEYSPAMIAAINKFLKDNGVDRPIKPGDAEDLLADELDEFEKDNILPFGNASS